MLWLVVPAGVARAAEPRQPLLVIGADGLRWSDVDPDRTPALAALLREGAIGDVAVRSVRTATCPIDGWLTISAGRRAADAASPDAPNPGNPPCRPVPPAPGNGPVPGWAGYLAAARAESYGATPGLLGDALDRAGICAVAQGPGAAIAIARSDGTMPGPSPQADPATAIGFPRCPLDVVDAGAVRDAADAPAGAREATAGDRATQVAAVDKAVGAALATAPASARVLVV